MVLITKNEREALDNVGLLKYERSEHSKQGYQEPNFVVINKNHKGAHKHVYVVETNEIMAFLERYDDLNLQKLNNKQLQRLLDNNIISESQVQHPNEYKPDAIVYIAKDGSIRCKKITNIMIFLGIWHSNKKAKPTNN